MISHVKYFPDSKLGRLEALGFVNGADSACKYTQTSGCSPICFEMRYRIDANGNAKIDIYALFGKIKADGTECYADSLAALEKWTNENPTLAYNGA